MKERILSSLSKVSGNGQKYKACCPAHEDRSPSLSLLFNKDGRILIHCHAGCEVSDVLAAIGLSLTDLYPDGAIRTFMATAAFTPKQNTPSLHEQKLKTARFQLLDEQVKQLKPGERLTEQTLQEARKLFLRCRREMV